MERVGAFISRLQQQYEQQAGHDALLLTARMLLAELQQEKSADNKSSKVAVLMPHLPAFAVNTMPAPDMQPIPAEQPTPDQAPEVPQPPDTIPEPEVPAEIPLEEPQEVPPTQPEEMPPPPAMPAAASINTYGLRPSNPAFFMPDEVPTLSQQPKKNNKELYELNGGADGEQTSLNDKLKQNGSNELMNKLQDEPIRDLKKAIGINDRYLFINELFRGDETMYERSIKTINSFNIYPEAAYWIQREMKYKLGWDDNNDTVKHFNQLVKRRFS